MKKTKKFTSESYKSHLKSQGKNTSKVIDSLELAHEMAKAGDYDRTKSSAIRRVGKMLIESVEYANRLNVTTEGNVFDIDAEKLRDHNRKMLTQLGQDVLNKNTAQDVALSLSEDGDRRRSQEPYAVGLRDGVNAAEAAVLSASYSRSRPDAVEVLEELHDFSEKRRKKEEERASSMFVIPPRLPTPTLSEVASSTIIPRRKNEDVSRHLEGLTDEEQKEILRKNPSWDYHFPFTDEELDNAIDSLVADRSRALASADTEEDWVKYEYEKRRLKKQKPSKARERLRRFD